MLRLLVLHGHSEQAFVVPDDEARLGSALDNDLIVRAPGVSRRHALVRRALGGVEVLDRGSKNGLFVEGRQVRRAILTPGLRVQIGLAWLTVEDVTSSEEALALLVHHPADNPERPQPTVSVRPETGAPEPSPADAALALAYHIAQVGIGRPGRRADLLARIRTILGAEAFLSFERRPRGKLYIFEQDGEPMSGDPLVVSVLARDPGPAVPGQVLVKRHDRLIVAGRESWFLAVKLKDEQAARETWRRDFLRFLAHRFFLPIRCIQDIDSSEARRILELVGGNKRRAAALLGISPGTLYKLVSPARRPRR